MVLHDSRKREYREPFGAAAVGTEVSIAIDVTDPAPESVRLMVWKDEALSPRYYTMTEEAPGTGRYRADFMTPDEGCLLWYTFEIKGEYGDVFADGDTSEYDDDPVGEENTADENCTIYYGNNKDARGGIGELYEYSPECYQITVYKPAEVPDWYKNGIVYQIFPDRFARDDGWRERTEAANKRINERRSDTKRVIQEDWTQPAYYVRDETGTVVEWPMYGGSLKGIENNLDYLRSLGVTCIYLNPVFEASSNHRYDTGDYMHIDPVLGTDKDFEDLAASAKEKGIRIILDGVFSHTGADSKYFDKYGNYRDMRDHGAKGSHGEITEGDPEEYKGAWGNEDSPYRSWFKFDKNERYGYKSWWGVEDLPEVDENDESYRQFILGEDGVVAHWIKKGASGWRLDVADELPDSFIAETRKRIKETDPEGLLLGEVWEDASNKISYDERRRYFLGDELDATMHYPLRDILLDYINYTISSSDAADRLMSLAENYPPQNYYGTLNLLGSHDRERIMTMMAAEEDYESATKKVKLLSALQYCLPGVPCIYYGDEAGLLGGRDPSNRSGFPWGFENLDLGYHYRMLGLLYDEHPALKGGDYVLLSGEDGMDDDILAFTRSGRDVAGIDEKLLILANRRYGPADIDLGAIDGLECGYALELLSSEELPVDDEGHLGVIHMDRLSAMIICLRENSPASIDAGRSAGVICHISSLPGRKLGKGARDFVDYIASAGFTIWQVLPLNPAGTGNSPYSSYAAFAGDPSFIDYGELPDTDGYYDFIKENEYWLHDYIAYSLLKDVNGSKPWYEWPEEHKNAKSLDVLLSLTDDQQKRASQLVGEQYCFYVQWKELKDYANSKGVHMMGDLPMFMAADSADVWANQILFRMDSSGSQKVHAGVPPDAFSEDGQDWGNPLYDWDVLKADGYGWWLRRIHQCAERFDILRIDHFRGFSEYYAIPEGGKPKNGKWQHGAGIDFIEAVKGMIRSENLGLKLVAEDLGFLDAGVKNLLKFSGIPGMDIWQFTAGEMLEMCEKEPEKAANRAFYAGTHDNDTLAGYIRSLKLKEAGVSAGDTDKAWIDAQEIEAEARRIITEIYESPAALAMMQIQDVFMLGNEARMNVPGIPEGNWMWKIPGDSIEEAFSDAEARAKWLNELAYRTGRINGR